MATKHLAVFFDDVAQASALVAKSSWERAVTAWLYVPLGVTCILAVCFGVHSLISLSSVSFPASVACMIGLFLILVLFQGTLGDRKTKQIVNLIEIPCGFALRYINIFFCPAFVTLPLSPSISGVEVAKIIAVFIIGYVAVFAFTAYMVRGLQLVLGTSKRAMTERAEELGRQDDNIPLTQTRHDSSASEVPTVQSLSTQVAADESSPSPPNGLADIQAPSKAMNPDSVTGTGGPPVASNTIASSRINVPIRHDAAPLTRPQRWAAFVSVNFDILTYGALFLFVGVPIYYGVGYAMPVQLSLNIVLYFAALRLPPKYRTYLHPVLVSSAFTILGIWILALIRQNSLKDGLRAYTTNTKYTQLWDNDQGLQPPGAGDMFGSVLDVSIVALSLPMYRYRNELKARFMTIIVPNVVVSIGSLFAYPMFCYHIGISAPRGLAFASRSLTLALATPATKNLGGDSFTVAPLCIFSGIAGVVVGPLGLDLLRIPKDDYITRGITLGANSSAVATALLLTTDPRAAAFSSLSMGLLGTITVALTSVPPLVGIIRNLVGAA
ncbi:hypothetical protein D6C84_06323 [Aureobasidium pullulans]|uniref:LrgB-domain-containing protein n=1 Tax=Aureobasidium pullulans TaxID=5580 RepID=A0A4S9XSA8_AURPU|nr:hypothetical protein D6C84_06323 [Aureobasidium pullulans]